MFRSTLHEHNSCFAPRFARRSGAASTLLLPPVSNVTMNTPQNELKYMRIRAKKSEVLVAFDKEFLVIIIQKWQPAA